MATVIKPKRSNSALSTPTASDLEIGEIAVNVADKVIYIRDSSGTVTTLSNFSAGGGVAGETFPTGDYGDISSGETRDAFNVITSLSFDCKTKPTGSIDIVELGDLS